MKKVWFFYLILVISIAWHISGYRNIKVQFPSEEIYIPRKDVKRLEYFFRELIICNSAGYTLLGNKPISFECFTRPQFEWDFSYLWHTFFPSNLKKYNAWKTWQKYKHLFNGADILIWSESSPWIKNGELIVIANRKQIERVIHENRDDFALLSCQDPKTLFSRVVHSHEGLLGILLGYGKTNAMLFHEHNHGLLKPVFSDEISQLFKTKKAAINFTLGWPDVEMNEILMFPNFMANIDAEETKRLKADYLSTREKILSYYANKNFLEATIRLLN